MRVKSIPLFVASVSLVLAATVYAGGWAILTVRNLPEYAVAGKPIRLSFIVRQHGISPMDGLKPALAAKSGARTVKASATRTKNTGEYAATMVFPQPGNWTIDIDTDYVDSTLPELKVIAQGSPTPPALSQIAVGERLFVAKGCIGCHANQEVQAKHLLDIGPDLTGKRFPETYLKSVLADPKTAFSRTSEPERGEMPNLGLTQSEIDALTAFINRVRP